MALTDKLTEIGNAIRSKTGTTNTLTLDEMAEAIRGISGEGGSSLEPLRNPADAYDIRLGFQAYDSNGAVIEGTRDFDSELQVLSEENAILSENNSIQSEIIANLELRADAAYNDGYSNGYSDGSGGLVPGHSPISYEWDEVTLTLTITEE